MEYPFKITLKNNLDGDLIITPLDKGIEEDLYLYAKDKEEHDDHQFDILDPDDKRVRMVVQHYPLSYLLDPILKHPKVVRADRCTTGREKTPTKSVFITLVGSPPSTNSTY